MADWTSTPPRAGSIATGFFPEARPKENWATNPRPLLVLKVYRGKASGSFHVLVAYGTTKTGKLRDDCLVIGNLSTLNALNLARPTAFVLSPGSNLAILPWSAKHFACWSGFSTPVISHIPKDMEGFVMEVLQTLTDIPVPRIPAQ